jgi:hypothetical protein
MKTLIPALLAAFLLAPSARADDGHAGEETNWVGAIEHYVEIGSGLAKDQTTGVEENAATLKELLTHEEELEGSHLAGVRSALSTLSEKGLDLKGARAGFRVLSKHFIPLAQKSYAHRTGDPKWGVYYCPMAKAEWIQEVGDPTNPYYGSDMLRCGTKQSDL